ncbi:MAG: SHOCT domain-containing protein [Haloferacaceae archaeon]
MNKIMFQVLQTCPYWGGSGMGMGGMWGPGPGPGGGGLLPSLAVLLVVAAVAVGGAYLLARRSGATGGSDRAMDLLREQYARGEIDDEEFDERSSRLAVE